MNILRYSFPRHSVFAHCRHLFGKQLAINNGKKIGIFKKNVEKNRRGKSNSNVNGISHVQTVSEEKE